jgi:hypothetical protein
MAGLQQLASSAGMKWGIDRGSVLLVRLCGLVTADDLMRFKAALVDLTQGVQICAIVADYTRAVLALDGESLDAVLEGESAPGVPSLPAAMVVPPAAVEMFVGHAIRMAGAGVTRRVFVESAPALAWAQGHALRLKETP